MDPVGFMGLNLVNLFMNYVSWDLKRLVIECMWILCLLLVRRKQFFRRWTTSAAYGRIGKWSASACDGHWTGDSFYL